MNMRKVFADEIHKQMKDNKNIWVLVGDMGYKMWDKVRDDYPDRWINTGAAETALVDIAIGLAISGKLPFVYTATPFLIYRPFESLRNYLDHENIPVRLVGGSRDRDYKNEGFSHWSEGTRHTLGIFMNITQYWPNTEDQIQEIVSEMLLNSEPSFISLRR